MRMVPGSRIELAASSVWTKRSAIELPGRDAVSLAGLEPAISRLRAWRPRPARRQGRRGWGSRMSESNRLGAVRERCLAARRHPARGDRRALPGGLHRGRAWEPCEGSQRDGVRRAGLEPARANAPRNLGPRCLPVPNHRRAKCRGRDSNPHGRGAPPGLSRRCLPVPNHHGVAGLGGGDRTHVVLLPKQAGQPLPYTQMEMERARGVEPLSVCLVGRRLADRPDPRSRAR